LHAPERDAREFLQDIILFGSWILILPNFVPISLLITLDTVRYIQGFFIEWDVDLFDMKRGV
jgi:phospholipid-transporting ATPase